MKVVGEVYSLDKNEWAVGSQYFVCDAKRNIGVTRFLQKAEKFKYRVECNIRPSDKILLGVKLK